MKSKVKQLKAKKGFTIIELVVVIAILGILVLLAMFALNGYTEKARITQIKNDVKVAEGIVGEYLAKDNSLPETWPQSNPKNSVSDIYDTRGLVDEVEDGNYRLIPKSEFNTKLTGSFHVNDGGKVYYEDDRQTEGGPLTDDEIAELIDEGFIPVANADELQRINGSGKDDNGVPIFEEAVWGAGTAHEGIYTGTLGSKYIQVQDIDLSEYGNWLPIGVDPGSPFNGIYNGGNYLINNLNIEEEADLYSAGLFGSISNGNVIISNIKMRNVNVDIDSHYSSMLIGDIGQNGEATLSIMNIDIEGNISGSGDSGGLIGFIDSDTTIGTIKDITIKGDISSTRYSSGLIGQAHTNIEAIENISIEGNVSSGGNSGGLIGFISSDEVGTIRDITIKSNISSTRSLVGGIVGSAYANIDTIENISIEGNVSSGGNVNGSGDSGGLIGFISSDTIGTIKDITIKGDISSPDSSAGGIVGSAYANIGTIENISIEGNVSSGGNSGGLIGYAGQDTIGTIRDITIKGDISSTDIYSRVGGIVAQSNLNIDTIENIFIEGNISGGGDLGGLIGYAGQDTIGTIRDITIKGDISSTYIYSRVGGVVGQLGANVDTIENVSIEGIIKGESAGGLIGGGWSSQLSNIYDVKIINSEINGIKNSGGLIGALYNSASIDKVLIKDTVIKSDSSHSGGLVGEVEELSASDITIENSNITGALSTGGIAGRMLGNHSLSDINIDEKTTINGFGIENEGTGGISGKVNSSTTSISDINISADITGIDNVGEIYGWVSSEGEGIIEDYHFDGTLSGTGDNVGGPYGYIDR